MKALIRMTNLKKYIWYTVVNFLTTPEEQQCLFISNQQLII
jgi:hypothetical protein